ncbi:MAG: hypothetical protein HYZ11_07235 [Candidatus Tectomicrobia bacterium]|uniref:Uncharacterized protein n=1 Tax=Tectimicrobiota bacterium TaxID=2528274 RepID=A0A932HXH0_UNCTE|nr:hypothetical protein [Candidatus Tectomicrobia bacterium]
MDVNEWQSRLENTFPIRPSPRLEAIIRREEEYALYVNSTYHGYRVFAESFFDFYLETLQKVGQYMQEHGIPREFPMYQSIALLYAINYRSLRAAENLLLCGYPLGGYSLFRDIKDRAIFLAAIVNGYTSLWSLFGFLDIAAAADRSPLSLEEYRRIRNRRKKEERKVFELMTGEKSGLAEPDVNELKSWEELFHEEVHSSRLTFFGEGGRWLMGKGPFPIGPVPDDSSIAMYMNRSYEIRWMLLRMLPYLQVAEDEFGGEWTKKWQILDESFRFVHSNSKEPGKALADAIVALIEHKFSFSPSLKYTECDG